LDIVVLCDFDGTIVEIDTAEHTLDRFAQGDWRTLDQKLDSGEMSLEECMRRQFMMVKVRRKAIVDELDRAVTARSGFQELVDHCESVGIPFTITSAGLDFYIRHFLRQRGLEERIELVAPRVRVTKDGVKFAFPKLVDRSSVSFKDDVVRSNMKKGKRVVYIGDGTTDFNAARIAHYPFAVRGSKLARLMSSHDIPHEELTDFRTVIDALRKMR
jgi:2-hydroxy-3-keto-5-methylthiopentenyl-1-phosphate phosphatase